MMEFEFIDGPSDGLTFKIPVDDPNLLPALIKVKPVPDALTVQTAVYVLCHDGKYHYQGDA